MHFKGPPHIVLVPSDTKGHFTAVSLDSVSTVLSCYISTKESYSNFCLGRLFDGMNKSLVDHGREKGILVHLNRLSSRKKSSTNPAGSISM